MYIRLFIVLCLVLVGCPKRSSVAPPPPANATIGLDQALASLEGKRYKEAEDRLTFVIFNFPGTREAADAQFYLGETYLRAGDYTQAQTEFDFYLKSFPNGRFQEQAEYGLGLAYYRAAPAGDRDQSLTLKAKDKFEDFLNQYPESEMRSQVEAALADVMRRLTGRDFNTALLYFKAGEFRSALTYYEYLMGRLPVEQWTGVDRLRLGICYQETDHPDNARPILEGLASGDFPPALKKEAESRLARLPPDTLGPN